MENLEFNMSIKIFNYLDQAIYFLWLGLGQSLSRGGLEGMRVTCTGESGRPELRNNVGNLLASPRTPWVLLGSSTEASCCLSLRTVVGIWCPCPSNCSKNESSIKYGVSWLNLYHPRGRRVAACPETIAGSSQAF